VAQLIDKSKSAYVYTQVFTCLYMRSYLCIYVEGNMASVQKIFLNRPRISKCM